MSTPEPSAESVERIIENWCRERGWICPPEGAREVISRALDAARREERAVLDRAREVERQASAAWSDGPPTMKATADWVGVWWPRLSAAIRAPQNSTKPEAKLNRPGIATPSIPTVGSHGSSASISTTAHTGKSR